MLKSEDIYLQILTSTQIITMRVINIMTPVYWMFVEKSWCLLSTIIIITIIITIIACAHTLQFTIYCMYDLWMNKDLIY